MGGGGGLLAVGGRGNKEDDGKTATTAKGQQKNCNNVTINLPAKDERHQHMMGGWQEVEAMRGLADDGR